MAVNNVSHGLPTPRFSNNLASFFPLVELELKTYAISTMMLELLLSVELQKSWYLPLRGSYLTPTKIKELLIYLNNRGES